MTAVLRSIRSDQRGAGLIELGLVMPVLLLLLLGTIDVSRAVAARLDLEQAAQRTTDFALAQRPRSSDGTYLKNEAVAASGVPAASVTIEIFLECNGTRQSDFNTDCGAGQLRARLVKVVIRRQFKPLFDWASLSSIFGTQVIPDPITMSGDSLVRFQ